VIAVVKANAYGHGTVAAARAFAAGGVDAFAVFRVEEARELRAGGVRQPILVIGPLPPAGAAAILDTGAMPNIHSVEAARALGAEARRRGEPIAYHLKVDTGIGRLGIPIADLPAFLGVLTGIDGLTMVGLFTHLACADDPDHPLTSRQIASFHQALAQVRAAGHDPAQVHLANSAASLRGLAPEVDTIRAGLAFYGYSPAPSVVPAAELRPALALRALVDQIKDVAPGDTLGYGATWTAARRARIASIACGYAEGYRRELSNRGEVLLRGRRFPVVGRVSMNLITVDVTEEPTIVPGEIATLLGEDGAQRVDAWELAERAGTIAWDILCGVDRRLPRLLVRDGAVVA
jgi:alanine racemase